MQQQGAAKELKDLAAVSGRHPIQFLPAGLVLSTVLLPACAEVIHDFSRSTTACIAGRNSGGERSTISVEKPRNATFFPDANHYHPRALLLGGSLPMKCLMAVIVAEFLGTLVLVLLGDGVVGSAFLLNMTDKGGRWMVITTGWALAVALAVYLTGKVSGGHVNPAVTLAQAVRGEFPWNRVLPYWAAQMAGAFAGAVIVYLDYFEAFRAFESANDIVRGQMSAGKLDGPAAGGAGIFSTYPAFDNLFLNLFSEFLGTLVLVLAAAALTDPRNQAPGANLAPLLIGGVVWSIGLSLGGLTGYAINPARDFGPRVASSLFGWGTAVFQSHGYYFLVPLIAPLAGGVAGGLLYDQAIRRFLPPDRSQV
jgi:glycerol uptake facilitator protein